MSPQLIAWLIILGMGPPLFFLAWLWQCRSANAGIVDLLWTLMIGFGGMLQLLLGEGDQALRLIAAILLGLWTLRLSSHLLLRLISDGQEDSRYQMLRQSWGKSAPYKMLGFFQLQALFVLPFIIPFALLSQLAAVPLWQLIAAIGLFCTALTGNALADLQLRRWRNNPVHQGRSCRAGLWSWSRHPNYFFEWLIWLSYLLFFLHQTTSLLIASVTPLGLLFLLVKVTGIPYSERCALARRGDDYRRYQQEVSAFVPWPPRSLSTLSSQEHTL